MAGHIADLFITEFGPAYIHLPQVPLAQVADSAALSFPHWLHWHLCISGLWVQRHVGWFGQGDCGLGRLAGSFSYNHQLDQNP